MDTVYGTKKYFQSLSAGSDIYRSSTCRAMTNDYSYQNTLGRRSTLGAYYHMNKQPSFTNEHSLGSHYGGGGGGGGGAGAYSTWGMWRDGRNLAPSTFSAKPHHPHSKSKSFSIILSTAAFIVLLAVISIAGLAFYFSSLKSNMEDTVIGFEGSFRIAKGDLFTTGLKYNHTTTYKQKIEFYKRFVERSLTDNALQPIRVDVAGFGDGPLIKVNFRTFLDVRKLPQNIHSVEEYIKESLFLETTALKSLYRSLRIDAESVEVKRILDEQLVKSASLSRETQMPPTSQTQLEKRLLKKGGILDKPTLKTLPTVSSKSKPAKPHSVDDEPDIDVENAPVIQGSFEGSFEITKTDADIARKKASPTKAYTSIPKAVTPFSLRVKPKKPTIDKVSAKPAGEEPTTTSTSTSSTTTTTTTTSTTTSTTTPKPTTPKPTTRKPTTTSTTTTSTTTTTTTTPPPPPPPPSPTYPSTNSPSTTTVVVPKLDANLFTSAPVLDTQPWKPIRGPGSEMHEGPQHTTTQTEASNGSTVPDEPLKPPMVQVSSGHEPYPSGFFNKPNFNTPETREDMSAPDMVYYHGFSGPVFMPGVDGIEPLGAAHVKPHPLPVPLIDDVMIPAFKPLNPTLGTNGKIPFEIETDGEKFEHLGGGVIVKKHDNGTHKTTTAPTTTTTTTTPKSTTTTVATTPMKPDKGSKTSELTHQIGEFLMDLLKLPNEEKNETAQHANLKLESRIEGESAEKPNFMNLKEIILQRNRGTTTTAALPSPSSAPSSSSPTTTTSTTSTTTTLRPPTTKRNRVRPSRPQKPVAMMDDSALFPSHSKWEFVNGSSPNTYGHTGSMRRVFNKTLQAWVSEDIEKTENLTLNDIKTRINNATNIQDISLIFDTLASKLGITPNMPTKMPNFSHNKLKISHKNDTKLKPSPTTSTAPTTTTAASTTSTSTSAPARVDFSQEQIRDSLESTYRPLDPLLLPEVIEGEAEVEVIDPNKYEEMLKSSQVPLTATSTTEMPKLVTLLPVRSNSGIRTFRPHTAVNSPPEGRRFSLTTPSEAVVKSGLHVTV